jgi:Flp pilus assembly protein TadG
VKNWKSGKGAALVEFAIVVMLLLVLVFGMIEYGLLISERLAMQQAAREGARSAAIGDTTSSVTTRVISSAPGITIVSGDITIQKQPAASGSWVALGNAGSQNDASFGDYVKVTVTKNHTWVTGLFSSSPTSISASMVARRE